MFDIGFWELVLISVVGLVVLGPERLPVAIRSVSKFIGSAKSMANSVKDELSHELKVQELQENLRKAEQMGMEDLSPELKKSVDELKQLLLKFSVHTLSLSLISQVRLKRVTLRLRIMNHFRSTVRHQLRQIKKPNSLARRSREVLELISIRAAPFRSSLLRGLTCLRLSRHSL